MTPEAEQTTIEVSFRWIVFFFVLVLGGGALGGALLDVLFPQRQAAIPTGEALPPTIEQIVVSPSEVVAEQINRVRESVVVIATLRDPATLIRTGTIVTNVCIGITALVPAGEILVVYDAQGRQLSVERVGDDPLLGISFFRLPQSVLQPLDIRGSDPTVGTHVTAVTTGFESFTAHAVTTAVSQYVLPPGSTSTDGVQRLLVIADELAMPAGTPLLDEAGTLSGLYVGESTVLPPQHISASFGRFTANRLEADPFTTFGFATTPTFIAIESQPRFSHRITRVTPGSAAARAGLRVGDHLTHVTETPVEWAQPLSTQLQDAPLTLHVVRDEEVVTLTLTNTVI